MKRLPGASGGTGHATPTDMRYFKPFLPSRTHTVLLCSPNLVLGLLVASTLEPWQIRVDVAATPDDAFVLLDGGAHYCLAVLDRRQPAQADRLRRHPLIDPQTIIEIEGAPEDKESIARTVTIAERQAEMLAPTIIECLDPVKLARELVH